MMLLRCQNAKAGVEHRAPAGAGLVDRVQAITGASAMPWIPASLHANVICL